jgi:hypothetical protein
MDISKATAFTKLAGAFVDKCEELHIEPKEGILSLARFFDVPITLPVTAVPNQSPNGVKLTPEEADKARQAARSEKARRLGLTPQEVMLTPDEAKKAKAKAREAKASGQPIGASNLGSHSGVPPKSSSTSVVDKGKGKEVNEASSSTSGSSSGPKLAVIEPSLTDMVRKTSKTRLESARKNAIRSLPTSVSEPSYLTVVNYSNTWRRLSGQWDIFRGQFNTGLMKNPLSGLPDPWDSDRMPLCSKAIKERTVGLHFHMSAPGTFILQDGEGRSYWDKDKPSVYCPNFLSEALAPQILEEFEKAIASWGDL